MEKLADLYGCDLYLLYEKDEHLVKNMLATAFRVDNLSGKDMQQIADFKSIVKNYLKMNTLLSKWNVWQLLKLNYMLKNSEHK